MEAEDEFISDREAECIVKSDEKFSINNGSYVSVVRQRHRESIRNSRPVDVVDVKVSGVVNVTDDSVKVEFEVEGEEYLLNFSESGNPSIRDLLSLTGCSSFSELYGEIFKTRLLNDGEPLLKKAFMRYNGRSSLYSRKFRIFPLEKGIFRLAKEGYPCQHYSEGDFALSWRGNLLLFIFSVLSIISTAILCLSAPLGTFLTPALIFFSIALAMLWFPALVMSLGTTYFVLLNSD